MKIRKEFADTSLPDAIASLEDCRTKLAALTAAMVRNRRTRETELYSAADAIIPPLLLLTHSIHDSLGPSEGHVPGSVDELSGRLV